MKTRWVVLLAGIAVAVLVLVLAPVSQRTAHAGVLDDLFDAWVNQDGEVQKQSEWKRFPNWQPPNGQLAKTDNWGRTTGVWGCIHWPQLHLSDFHHSGGYDVTCGYLSRFPTYDPSKEVPGVEPPPGQRWLCIPGTNVLIYSEPYNKGICGFFSKDFRPNGAFEPTRAQTDATDTAFDALLEFYSGNDAQENLKKVMKLYNDRSYLSTDQDLSQEKMPEPERQKIMALLDKGERQAACRAYAEAVTKAEGLDSVTKATLRTTQEYLDLSASVLPTGAVRGAFMTASLAVEGTGAPIVGGDKAFQAVIARYAQTWVDLRYAKHLKNSKLYAGYTHFNSASSLYAEWKRMQNLVETRGDRIQIRTTKCSPATGA